MSEIQLLHGDCLTRLSELPAASVHCCVTSPPYFGLRRYGGGAAEIGLEPTPSEYVDRLCRVFDEVWRVLRDDGTLWLNLGDCYAGAGDRRGGKGDEHGQMKKRKTGDREFGLKPKDMIGIPWRVAFALQERGWYLRSDIIWAKPNPMPESVTDRPTKAHEYLFLLAKSERYHYDADAIREPHASLDSTRRRTDQFNKGTDYRARPDLNDGKRSRLDYFSVKGRNKRTVWTVTPRPYKGAHFATFPPALVEPCILAGCPAAGVVLDPFAGSGTTLAVAARHGRGGIGIDLNPEYVEMARRRVAAAL